MTRINLGDVARDRITGFEGVVIARTQWLRGCDRLSIQPQTLHDGKTIEHQSFDEPDLELVKAGVIETTPPPTVKRPATGGPRPEPRSGR